MSGQVQTGLVGNRAVIQYADGTTEPRRFRPVFEMGGVAVIGNNNVFINFGQSVDVIQQPV